VVAIILVFGLVSAFRYFLNGPHSWLFWIIAIGILIAEFFLIRLIYSYMKDYSKDNVVLVETVTVDLDSQRAIRIEKMQSGKIKEKVLELGQVSRVVVNMEEHGHHHRLYLESPARESFQVSIAFATGSYGSNALIAHGRKIGRFLNKPVVLKHTDLGNIISEDTIQGVAKKKG
jgi:hypothetical protein